MDVSDVPGWAEDRSLHSQVTVPNLDLFRDGVEGAEGGNSDTLQAEETERQKGEDWLEAKHRSCPAGALARSCQVLALSIKAVLEPGQKQDPQPQGIQGVSSDWDTDHTCTRLISPLAVSPGIRSLLPKEGKNNGSPWLRSNS